MSINFEKSLFTSKYRSMKAIGWQLTSTNTIIIVVHSTIYSSYRASLARKPTTAAASPDINLLSPTDLRRMTDDRPWFIVSVSRQRLNHHPRAAVHRNAAIFKSDPTFDHPIKVPLWYLNWFKSYSVDKQTDRQTYPPTNRHY